MPLVKQQTESVSVRVWNSNSLIVGESAFKRWTDPNKAHNQRNSAAHCGLLSDNCMWILLVTLSTCITSVMSMPYNNNPNKSCYQCHAGPEVSVNNTCRSLPTSHVTVTILSCSHNCYIRYDSSGALSRGCFHTTFATVENEFRCQSIAASVYCFCEGDRCNNKSLSELAPTLTHKSIASALGLSSKLSSNKSLRSEGLRAANRLKGVDRIPHSEILSASQVIQNAGHSMTYSPQTITTIPLAASRIPKTHISSKKITTVPTKGQRRHHHGLLKSPDKSDFPYAFQSMFKNDYIY